MRHYEILFLVHPDQVGQISEMVKRYRELIEKDQGVIHRFEDWGRKMLAYPIQEVYRANFVLLNVSCEPQVINEIQRIFRFNNAIIRYLITITKNAVTDPSPMMRKQVVETEEAADQTVTSTDETSEIETQKNATSEVDDPPAPNDETLKDNSTTIKE